MIEEVFEIIAIEFSSTKYYRIFYVQTIDCFPHIMASNLNDIKIKNKFNS